MKRGVLLGTIFIGLLIIFQPQIVYADYNDDFVNELNRNNLRNIERLLERRAGQMNLVFCLAKTLGGPYGRAPNGFNKANCLDVLRLLVRYGADVNRQFIGTDAYGLGYSYEYGYPLENAIEQGHPLSVIQFLLDSGANPNLSSIYASVARGPINEAYRKRNTTVVNLLLERGTDGRTILPSAGSGGDNETIRQLISRGVQIRSDQGAEALRWAARGGHFDTVQLLVENGVNVNARASEGNSMIPSGATAASIAYDKGEMEIYDYLIAHGAREFEPRQTAQQPAAPSPSTTIVNVQPSAPAQSTPAPAQNTPATPRLSPGFYSDRSVSGSQINVTLVYSPHASNATGTAFHSINRTNNSQGNLTITGNQLVIDWYSGPLSGRRSVFRIDSANQFSNSGEVWRM